MKKLIGVALLSTLVFGANAQKVKSCTTKGRCVKTYKDDKAYIADKFCVVTEVVRDSNFAIVRHEAKKYAFEYLVDIDSTTKIEVGDKYLINWIGTLYKYAELKDFIKLEDWQKKYNDFYKK